MPRQEKSLTSLAILTAMAVHAVVMSVRAKDETRLQLF